MNYLIQFVSMQSTACELLSENQSLTSVNSENVSSFKPTLRCFERNLPAPPNSRNSEWTGGGHSSISSAIGQDGTSEEEECHPTDRNLRRRGSFDDIITSSGEVISISSTLGFRDIYGNSDSAPKTSKSELLHGSRVNVLSHPITDDLEVEPNGDACPLGSSSYDFVRRQQSVPSTITSEPLQRHHGPFHETSSIAGSSQKHVGKRKTFGEQFRPGHTGITADFLVRKLRSAHLKPRILHDIYGRNNSSSDIQVFIELFPVKLSSGLFIVAQHSDHWHIIHDCAYTGSNCRCVRIRRLRDEFKRADRRNARTNSYSDEHWQMR